MYIRGSVQSVRSYLSYDVILSSTKGVGQLTPLTPSLDLPLQHMYMSSNAQFCYINVPAPLYVQYVHVAETGPVHWMSSPDLVLSAVRELCSS